MSSYYSYRLLLWNIVNKRCLTKSSSSSASADRRPLLGSPAEDVYRDSPKDADANALEPLPYLCTSCDIALS